MDRIVSLHLSAGAVEELREREGGEVGAVLSRHGLKARPLFPGQTDPALASVWQVVCPEEVAERVAGELLRTVGVEGAYVEPEWGMPGGA